MRARGGILSSFSYVAADLADMTWFPLDSGVTGQYLPCSVTGQYHKTRRKSSPLVTTPVRQEPSHEPSRSNRIAEPSSGPLGGGAKPVICALSFGRSRSE